MPTIAGAWIGGLLYSPVATSIGLVYAYLPLYVLPLYASIDAIEDNWIAAAKDLNAGPMRAFWEAMRPYSNGAVYLNFPGLGEEGEQMVRASLGGNYERLARIKAAYDPNNLFRLNQNIKPAAR